MLACPFLSHFSSMKPPFHQASMPNHRGTSNWPSVVATWISTPKSTKFTRISSMMPQKNAGAKFGAQNELVRANVATGVVVNV